MLVFDAATLFWVEAEEVCVVAIAPVRTRTATKARIICFIVGYPLSCICEKRFHWTNQMR